jgi:hypothetical protein
MKKTFLMIASLLVLLLTTSGFNDNSTGAMPGNIAPMINLQNDSTAVELSHYRGKFVIVSFWSSADAQSRALCNTYNAWIKNNDPRNEKVCLLGVNFDENSTMFSQIVRADNLDPKTQFNAKGKNAEKINSDYHLTKGYGTLLIDPNGRVIAANPNPLQIAALAAGNI